MSNKDHQDSHVQFLRRKFEALALAGSGWFYNQLKPSPQSSPSTSPPPSPPPPLPKLPPPTLTPPQTPPSSESFESCSISSNNPRWSSDDNENIFSINDDNNPILSGVNDTFGDGEVNEVLNDVLNEFGEFENKSKIICETKNYGEFSDDDEDEFYDSFDDSSDDETQIQPVFTPSLLSVGKIPNIVKELMSTEEDYIQTLKVGIENYISIMDCSIRLPQSLKGHKYTIFCTIEKIYKFHTTELLPKLKECDENIEKICETIREMIKIDRFYLYVLYGMNKPRSQAITKQNQEFFKERQNEIGDKLGINSFLMQPIQRIFKYSLLLRTAIGELGKHYTRNEEFKVKLATCCKAEKDIQRLLDSTNEAITLNDIEHDEQSYNINLSQQGKFLKAADFDIFDPKCKTKKFKGRLFIFERLIIYTEYNYYDNTKLNIRGKFTRERMSIRLEGKKRFYLSTSMQKSEEIRFTGTLADEVIHFINGILMKVAEEEKRKITRQTSYQLIDRKKANTLSINTNRDSTSTISLLSNRTSLSSHDSYEISNTTWEERKNFERIRNSEKYYIQMIKTNIKLWINNLHPDIKRDFIDFTSQLEEIYNFHNQIFYPSLIECGSDYQMVINLFKTHLNNNSFNMYILYSSIATQTANELQKYHILPTLTSTVNVQDFVRLPVKRISDYMIMIDMFVQELQTNDLNLEIFKEAAILQAEFNGFYKIFDENYKLYSIQQTMVDITKYGNVIYSDLVSIDIFTTLNHRIFIMEKGILCVKVKESSKTKIENFLEIISSVLYTVNLHLRGSKKHPKRVEFDTDLIRSIITGVTFRTLEKRDLFCERLNNFINIG